MRKTSPEEIEQLYEFTRRHYVEFSDVQTELVDHLASAMDENWEQEPEPELSFEENLQREFRSFGVFGFSEVVEKKSRALAKRYFRLIWREMKFHIQVPETLLSFILIYAGIFLLLKYGSMAFIAVIVVFYFGILCYWMHKTQKELRQKKKKGERLYLLEASIMNTGSYFWIIYLPFQIFYFSDISYTGLWVQLITALIFSLVVYSCYVCFYVLPRKRDVILKEQYPELKF